MTTMLCGAIAWIAMLLTAIGWGIGLIMGFFGLIKIGMRDTGGGLAMMLVGFVLPALPGFIGRGFMALGISLVGVCQ